MIKSKEILPDDYRLSEGEFAKLNRPDETSINSTNYKLVQYHKALITAENELLELKDGIQEIKENYAYNPFIIRKLKEEIFDLKRQLGESLTKEFFKKEVVKLNKEIKDLKTSKSQLRASKKSQADTIINAYKKDSQERYEKAIVNYHFSRPSYENIMKSLKIAAGIK